jgi:hypothetical protein
MREVISGHILSSVQRTPDAMTEAVDEMPLHPVNRVLRPGMVA